MSIRTFFRGFKNGFKSFGHSVSTVVNFFLFSFVYFVAIGLTSIIAKIFRKKFLELKHDEKKTSYWLDYNLSKQEKERYERMF